MMVQKLAEEDDPEALAKRAAENEKRKKGPTTGQGGKDKKGKKDKTKPKTKTKT